MLSDDFELAREDVQDLSTRDALVGFFAQLGYHTNERLVQSVGAMGLTGDLLKSSITHIERLASEDGGLLEVYLIELKSVTVSATQALARAFRNLSVQFPLLVLTDDYQRLDFVLVERYTAPTSAIQENMAGFPGPAPRKVSVRPRVLTVHRLKPGYVGLRVLRRFSYTESDSFAQYDKLLSAYVVADWSEPFFNNRALFSDHYLTQRLPASPEWQDRANAASMTRAFQTLRTLYADVRERFANEVAARVRAKLIEPALATLGFAVQATMKQDASALEPTYRLYAQSDQTLSSPLALCLAYAWGRSLDGKDDQRDSETPDENPGAVVVSLLERAEANWAIVTNGKIWRLYSARAHSRATNYYEIDLEETLALPRSSKEVEEAFRYFWFLFRVTSFQPVEYTIDDKKRQMCFLENLVSESERYARELGERLKERIFLEIFPHFARGFIRYARQTDQLPANLEMLPDEERNRLLEPFFGGTLTFLYRLLFLLYAESRDLLPVREARGYYEMSLEKLKREIAERGQSIRDQAPGKLEQAYGAFSTTLYERLQLLFQAVDAGNAAINVPVYNGGLFVTQPDPSDSSPEAAVARFLTTYKIPDRQLALGLDLMTRDLDEKKHDLVFIDYKSLGVRQLGSIYEGLLEFKLRVASTEMAVVKGKKTEENIPYAEAVQKKLPILKEGRGKEAQERTFPKGTVYLENDRRERKATGSYYTPDYIVEYIVEQTVGPVLQEKLEALRPVFREAERTLRNQHEKAEALKKQRMRSDDPEHETYLHYRKTLNEVFFDLKVLDPAMGSGHFLVEVVDYITDRMADFLAAFRWNPVVYELAQTRREIQEEMERQGISIDLSKLTDLNLLKRRVLKSCIYGVDLNQMAVELAKVSLWLDCFTLGAPLSFLDHHMKCGNSLIGASIEEARAAIEEGQLSLFGSNLWAGASLATKSMIEVGRLSDVTAGQVRESKQHYHSATDALAPFKRILHIYVSRWFGNEPGQAKRGKAAVDKAIDFLRSTEAHEWCQHPDRTTDLSDEQRSVVTVAEQAAQQQHFFHWELEFPEVFFDEAQRKEQGGFDAVVGNPPYVRQEGLGDDKIAFKELYTVFNSIADLYTYFIERGHTLLRRSGRFGMITANKFMRANYGAALRSLLINKVKLEKLIDFGDLPVFGDASAYPIIILSSNRHRAGNLIEYANIRSLTFESMTSAIQSIANSLPESVFGETSWFLAEGLEQSVLKKLKEQSIPLKEYTKGAIRRGILTGFNKAFIIDRATRDQLIATDSRNQEIIKPFIMGEDIRKYTLLFQERFLIWTYIGVPINLYPTIFKHLQQYQSQLEKRWDKGEHWWELRHCDYYTDFNEPKIMWPVIAASNKFVFDNAGYYSNDKTFFIPTNDLYLLAVLNSSTAFFFFNSELSGLRGGYLEYRAQTLVHTPIRYINFTLSPDQRTTYLAKAKKLYQSCLDKDDLQGILSFVDHHLSQQPEESDVVHDLLAFLAEEMMRLNREKRAAQREFLDLLVAVLKILPDKEGRVGIEALTGKAKLSDYPGDYQKGEPALAAEALLEILRKNKNRLGVSLNDAGLVDTIESMYAESLQRVLPLKETLRKTDALIDAVVYRLYGLTEEEIRVVEGRDSRG